MNKEQSLDVVLLRVVHEEKQTLGWLYVYNFEGEEIFKCRMLELPDRENARNVSRIPPGKYPVSRRISERYKSHYHVKHVPNRDMVLIHAGNYYRDTRGCLLPGSSVKDLDGDGFRDVHWSSRTLGRMLEVCGGEFVLNIIDIGTI